MTPELGAELKRIAAERGETLVSIASALGLYVNSVRSWMRRNRFPIDPLRKIVRHLGLPDDLDTLQRRYDFELAGARKTPLMRIASMDKEDRAEFGEAMRTLCAGMESIARHPMTIASQTRLMFKCLGSDGIYICTFLDTLPFELSPTGWAETGREVCKAIHRGATLLYICPYSESLAQAHGLDISSSTATPAAGDLAVQRLRERVRLNSGDVSEEKIASSVYAVSAKSQLFQAPGHVWIALRGSVSGEIRTQLFLRSTLAGATTRQTTLFPLDAGIGESFMSHVLDEAERTGNPRLLSLLYSTR
jgi:hypothetical protein